MNAGIYVSSDLFQHLSDETQQELIAALRGKTTATEKTDALKTDEMNEFDLADLSVGQLKKVIGGCSDRPKHALKIIANCDENGFLLRDIASEMDEEIGNMRTVWSAITRRVRAVLDDNSATLISWEEYDGDWVGRLSDITFNNIQKIEFR